MVRRLAATARTPARRSAYVGWHSAPGTGTGEAFVLPEHRGAGVGSALYRELASWVEERGCVTLETTVAEDDEASLAWVDRRGFREVGTELTDGARPHCDRGSRRRSAGGVEIVSWAERPDLAPGLYEVACRGVPGRARTRRHRRCSRTRTGSRRTWAATATDPEATFIALADGEVAGYAKLSISKADSKVAHHDMTGVRRAFRGRGIAGALKRAEIAWAKEAGYESLADEQRGAERADPPAQRAPRLRAAARPRRPARLARRDRLTDDRRSRASVRPGRGFSLSSGFSADERNPAEAEASARLKPG